MTPEDAALCERLKKVDSSNSGGGALDIGSVTTNWYRNPDGPAAAAAIERLSAENEALRKAAEALRDEIENQRDLITHPNGRRAHFIDSTDQIRVDLLTDLLARTTLKGADQ